MYWTPRTPITIKFAQNLGAVLCRIDFISAVTVLAAMLYCCEGLALGVKLAEVPWQVHGVMLAAPVDYYLQQQAALTAAFSAQYLPGDCRVCVKPECSAHVYAPIVNK